MSKTMTIKIPTSGDSSTRTQTKTVTIPNLKSVDNITVNTGTVSYTKTGNDVAITCQNGASVRQTSSQSSITPSIYQQSSSNSFPASIPYDDGTYKGTLYKSGLSYVKSGSYTPSDTIPVTYVTSCTIYADWQLSEMTGTWVKIRSYNNAPSSITYDPGTGYSGPLSLKSVSGGTPPAKTGPGTPGEIATTSASGNATYSGDITKPASDTRVWEQLYTNTVYGPATYTDYYAYTVTLTYTDSVKLGTVNYKTTSGIVSLPVYDLTMALPILRIKVGSAIGCFELVPTNDSRASNIRINTQYGIKAIAKS